MAPSSMTLNHVSRSTRRRYCSRATLSLEFLALTEVCALWALSSLKKYFTQLFAISVFLCPLLISLTNKVAYKTFYPSIRTLIQRTEAGELEDGRPHRDRRRWDRRNLSHTETTVTETVNANERMNGSDASFRRWRIILNDNGSCRPSFYSLYVPQTSRRLTSVSPLLSVCLCNLAVVLSP